MVRMMVFGLVAAVMLASAPACMAAGDSNRAKAERLNRIAVASTGDSAEALAALQEAIRLAPMWDAPYYNLAIVMLERGEVDHAIADFTRALELAEKPLPQHYGSRATAYRANGEYGKSLADARKAVELAPSDPTQHAELGLAYGFMQMWREAIEECSISLKADPRDYEPLVMRGVARCKVGELEAGMEDFSEAIRADPKGSYAYLERASILLESERDADAALRDCEEIFKLRPRGYREERIFADAHRIRGALRRKKGDADGAMADLTEALRLNPKHARALIERGRIHGEKGDYKKAVADFSEHIRYYPHDPAGYEMRGLAYLALGNTEAAAADQRKLQELGKKAAAEKDAK